MRNLIEQADAIFESLVSGQIAKGFELYPDFIDAFINTLTDSEILSFQPLLQEMLKAQEEKNVVWLADLIAYLLIPALNELHPR
ncbi:hypothetical protein GCM10011352_37440 [Marinobacterium zhoushanense]|uniref:Uncharacterized protein n=1 Tax=Marinobacterium zhoushanense TaxID=1679163 RepID=A0ABQ1KT90_9GAMM|nr:hypothetical protein [Marinobacterium zhoushanense]GGC07666.1 hypothetical protein GCM10011352_37440 [Marinobacterium zhoushanense]